MRNCIFSGGFIYNGLNQLSHINDLAYQDEVFEIQYNLSVGFERLIKIALVLAEYGSYDTQEKFEKSLITHNHQMLIRRLRKKCNFKLSSHENSLLQCLSRFYQTHRYGRYSLATSQNFEKEAADFWAFLEKGLSIKITREIFDYGKFEMARIKKFIGKTCMGISNKIYSNIESLSTEQSLFTYEIRYRSKASKIFLYKEGDFHEEEIIWKELLLYLIKSENCQSIDFFLSDLQPLDFEEYDILDALDHLGSSLSLYSIRDTVKTHYEDGSVTDVKSRIEQLRYLGSKLNHVEFEVAEDEGE